MLIPPMRIMGREVWHFWGPILVLVAKITLADYHGPHDNIYFRSDDRVNIVLQLMTLRVEPVNLLPDNSMPILR